MSFDVFMQRFKGGDEAEVEREPVLALLHAVKHTEFDEFGFSTITFHDGVDVEFSASGLASNEPFTGCAFHIRGYSKALARFMFDVACAGDLVTIPAMDGAPLGLVTDVQERELPPEMRGEFRLVPVRSSADLEALLIGGFEALSGYRDNLPRGSAQS